MLRKSCATNNMRPKSMFILHAILLHAVDIILHTHSKFWIQSDEMLANPTLWRVLLAAIIKTDLAKTFDLLSLGWKRYVFYPQKKSSYRQAHFAKTSCLYACQDQHHIFCNSQEIWSWSFILLIFQSSIRLPPMLMLRKLEF